MAQATPTPSQMIQTFTERHPLVGPALWIASAQFLLVQFIVAWAWVLPAYNWMRYTISDLGNTACGPYGDRVVCSPQHNLFNISIIILGVTMLFGSVLIYQGFAHKNRRNLVGFSLMAASGAGTLLVGLAPENVMSQAHFVGAVLGLFVGNLALLVLGFSLDIPTGLRLYTIASGLIAQLALILFGLDIYLGLGIGGMERLAAHPLTIWLVVFGIYVSKDRLRQT